MERDQATQDNNINVSDDNTMPGNSLDGQDSDGSDSNDRSDNHSDNSPTENDPKAQQLPRTLEALGFNRWFNGSAWGGVAYSMIFPYFLLRMWVTG